MAATRIIPVRVTASQYEKIRQNATRQGFRTVSEYIRTHALAHNMPIQCQVQKLETSIKQVHELLAAEKLK